MLYLQRGWYTWYHMFFKKRTQAPSRSRHVFVSSFSFHNSYIIVFSLILIFIYLLSLPSLPLSLHTSISASQTPPPPPLPPRSYRSHYHFHSYSADAVAGATAYDAPPLLHASKKTTIPYPVPTARPPRP